MRPVPNLNRIASDFVEVRAMPAEVYYNVYSYSSIPRRSNYPMLRFPNSLPYFSEKFDYSLNENHRIVSIYKFCTPNCIYYNDLFLLAHEMISRELSRVLKPITHVNKFSELLNEIELDSSPGAVFRDHYKTKREFYAAHPKLLDDPSLYSGDSLWLHFPKREILKIGKDVRDIDGSCALLTAAAYPLVRDFNHGLEVKGDGLPLYLGTTMRGKDWFRYVDVFSECESVVAIDAVKMDTTIQEFEFLLWESHRYDYIPIDHHRNLEWVITQTLYKYIVDMDGRIFCVDHGNSTGSQNTSHTNSGVTWQRVYVCCIKVQTHFPEYDVFSNLRLAIYGDDAVIGFVKAPPFTVEEFFQPLLVMGITLEIGKWSAWHDVDFLSCVPKHCFGHWVPTAKRHEKMLASMKLPENPLPIHDEILRLIDLRNQTYCTPSFEVADRLVVDYINSLDERRMLPRSRSFYSSQLFSEHELAFIRLGFTVPRSLRLKRQIGSVGACNNQISEPKRMPPKATKKKNNKPKTHPAKRMIRRQRPKRRVAPYPRQQIPRITQSNLPAGTVVAGTSGFKKMTTTRGQRVVGREMFNQVTMYAGINNLKFQINPSNNNLFPKLSREASMYEKYKIRNLKIRYLASCPSTTTGNLVLAFYYDTGNWDGAPTNFQDLCNLEGAVYGTPIENLTLNYSKRNEAEKEYYCSVGQNDVPAAERQESPAILLVDVGYPAATTTAPDVGFLVVEYDIELINFIPPSVSSAAAIYDDLKVPAGQNGNTWAANSNWRVVGPKFARINSVQVPFWDRVQADGSTNIGTIAARDTNQFFQAQLAMSTTYTSTQFIRDDVWWCNGPNHWVLNISWNAHNTTGVLGGQVQAIYVDPTGVNAPVTLVANAFLAGNSLAHAEFNVSYSGYVIIAYRCTEDEMFLGDLIVCLQPCAVKPISSQRGVLRTFFVTNGDADDFKSVTSQTSQVIPNYVNVSKPKLVRQMCCRYDYFKKHDDPPRPDQVQLLDEIIQREFDFYYNDISDDEVSTTALMDFILGETLCIRESL